jgi:hypothetical protein
LVEDDKGGEVDATPEPPNPRESIQDAINLLLEEYRTLREEVVSRMAGRVQLLSFTIAGAGLASNSRTPTYAAIAGGLVVVGLGFWTRSKRGIERVADQIATLECRINTLAAASFLHGEEGGPDMGVPTNGNSQRRRSTT